MVELMEQTFRGDENPPNRPQPAAGYPDDADSAPNNTVDREAIDNAISSLGGPIHKTIVWHTNNRGVFGDTDKIDIDFLYQNLRELLGPGADMIMGEFQHKNPYGSNASPKIFINGNGRNDEPPAAAGCTNQPKSTAIPDDIKSKLKK